MKTAPLAALAIIGGLAAGGGASFATGLILGGSGGAAATHRTQPEPPPTFVATGKILAPLVFPGGRLAGYVNFEIQLETAPDRAEFVKERLPYLFHAVNMRTFHTPMTSGPDGMLPDLAVFRAVVAASAVEAFGPGVVRRVAIVQATPA